MRRRSSPRPVPSPVLAGRRVGRERRLHRRRAHEDGADGPQLPSVARYDRQHADHRLGLRERQRHGGLRSPRCRGEQSPLRTGPQKRPDTRDFPTVSGCDRRQHAGEQEGIPMSLNTWPETERPREKLLRLGSATLSEAELLAILLQTGTRGCSALEMARAMLGVSLAARTAYGRSPSGLPDAGAGRRKVRLAPGRPRARTASLRRADADRSRAFESARYA